MENWKALKAELQLPKTLRINIVKDAFFDFSTQLIERLIFIFSL